MNILNTLMISVIVTCISVKAIAAGTVDSQSSILHISEHSRILEDASTDAADSDRRWAAVEAYLKDTDYGEGGDLILGLYLRDLYLSDGLFALVEDNKIFLPLGELTSYLRVAVVVDAVSGIASGWIYTPENRFDLDLKRKIVTLAGNTEGIIDGLIIRDEGDIYIEAQTLEKWLDFKLDINLHAQNLVIRSQRPLPPELESDRHKRELQPEQVFGATRPYDIPGYRALDWPSADINLGGFYGSQSDTARYDYSMSAAGDLAFMNGRLFAAGNNDSLKSMRLTLGRYNPRGMLGPLQISSYEFGDTQQFLPAIIGGGFSGRGLKFSNARLATGRDFDRITLQGDLLPEYEVELYVNNRLISVVRESDDNRYTFTEVPLKLGQNELRLEFYGPQGQRLTETRRTFVGSGQNKKGQLKYEAAVLQNGRKLFEGLEDIGQLDNTTDSAQGFDSALSVSYGLSNRATFGLSYVNTANTGASDTGDPNNTGDRRSYLNARLGTTLAGYYVSTGVAMDADQHLAGELRLRSSLGDYELSMSHILYSEGYRRLSDSADATPQELQRYGTTAELARRFSLIGTGGYISWGLNAAYQLGHDESQDASFGVRADYVGKSGGWSWLHSYRRNLDEESGQSSGQLGVGTRALFASGWTARAELDYADSVNTIVRAGSLGLYRPFGRSARLSLQASRNLSEESNHYSVSWQQQQKKFRWSSSVTGSSTDDVALRLDVSFSGARYPGRMLPFIDSSSSSGSPRVGARVFVDDNNNQTHDDGEEVVEGIRLTRNGLLSSAITDEKGYAMLDGLTRNNSVDIGIVASDIKNPELREAPNERGVLPRPGRLPIIEIPLVRSRDLEGEVLIEGQSPAPNVNMILRNADGGEPLKVVTEFDGVYYITGIPLGNYTLEPDPEQLQSIGLHSQPERRAIVFGNGENIVSRGDFNLVRGQRLDLRQNETKYPVEVAASSRDQANPATRTAESVTWKTPASPVLMDTVGADTDADGVIGPADQCPNTPPGSTVRNNGCVVVGGVLSAVTFKAGSATFDSKAAFELNALARELNNNPELHIVLETHTDNRGNASTNMALSKKRAQQVAQYLIKTGKVPSRRLAAIAYGESTPLVSNRTSQGRKTNRRVRVIVNMEH